MNEAENEKNYVSKSSDLRSKIQLILLLPIVLVVAIVADCLGISWARG